MTGLAILRIPWAFAAQQVNAPAAYALKATSKTGARAVFCSPAIAIGRVLPQQIQPDAVEDVDAYAVWSVLLKTKYFRKGLIRYVIAAGTNCETTGAFIGCRGALAPSGGKQPQVASGTSADFDAKNKQSHHVSEKFTRNIPDVVVTEEELKKIFRLDAKSNVDEESWRNFYKKYPETRRIFGFARVGFNSKKDEALVYVSNHSGFVGGSGVFLVLSKRQLGWEVKNEVILWLS